MPNYQQPDFRNPTSAATVQVENVTQPGNPFANTLGISFPLPRYIVEPGVDTKLDPSGNIRAGKSGKGSPG